MCFDFLGSSKVAQTIRSKAELAASSDFTVLLFGETGTGKEILAQAIHKASKRSRREFVTVNCSAMPDTLVESEFFGHMKGSFTGAAVSRVGLFEAADLGTLFLDEIGDMLLGNQRPLLRFMSSDVEGREVRRVGGTVNLKVNVRVIAATNKDLKQMVVEKQFREDLYYRLNAFPIYLPPIRQRKEDIPSYVRQFAIQHGPATVSQEAIGMILQLEWKGNFRELRQTLEVAIARARLRDHNHIVVQADDFCLDDQAAPDHIVPADYKAYKFHNGFSLPGHLRSEQINLVQAALEQSGNRLGKAAELLGITRNNLARIIRTYMPEIPRKFRRNKKAAATLAASA